MSRSRKAALGVAMLALVGPAAAGFDANGVALGADEAAVEKRFPNAHCQMLQWQSRAADRRCDDSRASVAGMEGSITFYLKAGAVEAYDWRFDARNAEQLAKLLTERFGHAPVEKASEKARTLQWRGNGERALLSTEPGRRRATLLVWRGAFYDEIYKVR